LWSRRIIRERGPNGYDFTHDKLREVAYAETIAPQRRLLHRRIARAVEAAHTDELDSVSGVIAAHYERAGMPAQAIPHYARAATVATRVFANDDAIALLSRALALLESVPAGSKSDLQELDLLLALAPILRVAKGWTAPGLDRVLERALALCDTGGDDPRRMEALLGLQILYQVQARFDKVQYLSGELDTLYQRAYGRVPRVAKVTLACVRMQMGHLQEADEQFAAISAGHDPELLQLLQEAQGLNYTIASRIWHAHAQWFLGYPQSALCHGHDAVRQARELQRPFDHVMASAYQAILVQFCADEALARAHAEEALELANEFSVPYYRAWSTILVEYARAWAQPDAEHTARLRAAIAAFVASGARLRLPYYLSLLAQVHGKGGRTAEGLSVIDEALAAAHGQGEHLWDAELHRLRGDLLGAAGAEMQDIGAPWLKALAIARSQGARSLELRAATRLAHLWGTGPRAAEGRRLRADLYAWFTEGYEMPDLRAARAVLALLA
jgi:predicted ATPase